MRRSRERHLRAAVVLAAASLGLAGPAHANSSEGKVKSLTVRASDGLHYVVIDGAAEGRAACATNTTYYMIVDEHSDAGKSQMRARARWRSCYPPI